MLIEVLTGVLTGMLTGMLTGVLTGVLTASAVQNDFFETLFYVYNKRFQKNILTQWPNSVTINYNYLLIVMNSAFNYSLSGLLGVHKLKHFLRGK